MTRNACTRDLMGAVRRALKTCPIESGEGNPLKVRRRRGMIGNEDQAVCGDGFEVESGVEPLIAKICDD